MELAQTLSQIFQPDSFSIFGSDSQNTSIWHDISSDFALFSQSCHNSYENGLLRFLLPNSKLHLGIWEEVGGWGEDWALWKDTYRVFAYDWQARLFAFDLSRKVADKYLLAMLDTATGKAFNSKSKAYLTICASKCCLMKRSLDLREQALRAFGQGLSRTQVCQVFGIHRTTLRRWQVRE